MEREYLVIDEICTPKIFQSVIYLYVAANALKVLVFYIMFRAFILAGSISNKLIISDIFECSCFLNDLFIFRLIKYLLRKVNIYLFVAKETPSIFAIANSARRSK
jgi:hypothetical protein